MIKYKVDFWNCEIEEIEVISETTAFVVMIDKRFSGVSRRVSKEKDGHAICDTFDDAKNALYSEADRMLKAANAKMLEAKEYLAKIDRQKRLQHES